MSYRYLKVGLRLECLGLPFRKALDEAARLGVGGVQFDASGELAPSRLSDSGRRELKTLLRMRGLELAALGCPLRYGLDEAQNQHQRVDTVRDVMTLAYELGPRTVVVQAGQVPESATKGVSQPDTESKSEDDPRARLMRDALATLGQHGDHVGTTLALDTGLESGECLRSYLNGLNCGSLRANLSPGNLWTHGFNPYAATRELKGLIAHVHATDARRSGTSRAARQTALGAGDIDWMTFLETLVEVEYRGWIVVTRDEGERKAADTVAGLVFLKRLLGIG